MTQGAGKVLRTGDGRLRLGWRLLGYVLATACVAMALGLLLPESLLSGSAALLFGACVGGWLMLAEDGRAPAALGFHLGSGVATESLRGLALGVATAAVAVLVIVLAGGVAWTTEPGSWVGWLRAGVGALLFLAIPAAAEEAPPLGYPLQALTEAWGAGRALVVTSTAFALLHLSNPGVTALAVVNVGVAGFWLGVVWLRTGSLWWATGAHLGWNWGSAYAADLPVSGLELFDAPWYEGVTRGPGWLGGGTFGPEGSVLTTLALAAASVWCWKSGWLKPSPTVMAASPLAVLERN